jgi:flagellar basal body-associated protein FliL
VLPTTNPAPSEIPMLIMAVVCLALAAAMVFTALFTGQQDSFAGNTPAPAPLMLETPAGNQEPQSGAHRP